MSVNAQVVARRNEVAIAARTELSATRIPLSEQDKIAITLDCKRKHPFHGYIDVTVTGAAPFIMFSNNDDPVALQYFWIGDDAWEPYAISLWIALLRADEGAVLDVGAFSGLYSLIAASLGKTQIFSAEPSRMPLVRLLENISANGFGRQVTVIPKAISDTPGPAFFNLRRELGTLSTAGSLEALGTPLQEPVLMTTLDIELGSRSTKISTMKVDVEGSEISLIRGMQSILKEDQPNMIIEIKSHNLEEAKSILSKFGYSGWIIDEERKTLNELTSKVLDVQNYLFSRDPQLPSKLRF